MPHYVILSAHENGGAHRLSANSDADAIRHAENPLNYPRDGHLLYLYAQNGKALRYLVTIEKPLADRSVS